MSVYVVQAGDVLGTIAEHELGHYELWPAIATLNEIPAPYTITPGERLALPPKPPADLPITPALVNALGAGKTLREAEQAAHDLPPGATLQPVVRTVSAPAATPSTGGSAAAGPGLLAGVSAWAKAHPRATLALVAFGLAGAGWYLKHRVARA